MSSQQQLFTINGLVDTNKGVWANAEALAGASAAYLTWDPYIFKYGVVINEPGVSTRSFNDNNIIGAMTVTETPFDEQYNSCEVRFPNKDIRDKIDTIKFTEPAINRFDNEPDNKLDIQFDFVNDPIQADVIAITELKQSRVNKTISFSTDFTNLDVAAGDVIDVTNSYWGWDQKLFRVVQITQTDTEDRQIILDIIAVEYDSEVYNYNNLSKYSRTIDVGVPNIKNNAPVEVAKDESVGAQVGRALATDTGKTAITAGGVPVYDSQDIGFSVSTVDTALNNPANFYGAVYQTDVALKNLQIIFEGPYGTVDYDVYVDEVQESRDYVGQCPLTLVLQYSTDNVTYTTKRSVFKEFTGNDHVFNLTDAAAGYYKLTASVVNTLTLDQDVPASITTNKAIVDITGFAAQTLDPSGDASTISFVSLE